MGTAWGPKPSDDPGGRYLCNERKHVQLVGFQLNGDEDNPYVPSKTFYGIRPARQIIDAWAADKLFNRTASNTTVPSADVEPHLVNGRPKDDNTGLSNFYDFIVANKRSLCMM